MKPERRLDAPPILTEMVWTDTLKQMRVMDLSNAELDAEDLRLQNRTLDAVWRPLVDAEMVRRLALVAPLLPAAKAAWQTYLVALDATRYGAVWETSSLKHRLAWCAIVQAVRDHKETA